MICASRKKESERSRATRRAAPGAPCAPAAAGVHSQSPARPDPFRPCRPSESRVCRGSRCAEDLVSQGFRGRAHRSRQRLHRRPSLRRKRRVPDSGRRRLVVRPLLSLTSSSPRHQTHGALPGLERSTSDRYWEQFHTTKRSAAPWRRLSARPPLRTAVSSATANLAGNVSRIPHPSLEPNGNDDSATRKPPGRSRSALSCISTGRRRFNAEPPASSLLLSPVLVASQEQLLLATEDDGDEAKTRQPGEAHVRRARGRRTGSPNTR